MDSIKQLTDLHARLAIGKLLQVNLRRFRAQPVTYRLDQLGVRGPGEDARLAHCVLVSLPTELWKVMCRPRTRHPPVEWRLIARGVCGSVHMVSALTSESTFSRNLTFGALAMAN